MSESKAALQGRIDQLMRSYYERYYRRDLSLPDWRERTERRLTEEANLGEPQIQAIEDWMGFEFRGKRILVVGAGTGAEGVVFAQRGAEVHGIEPSSEAMDILRLKAELHGIPAGRFQQATAEQIPHPDGSFDFVYCYTVIEHVQDVERSIDEMIRVCKVGGTIYIQTPEYRFPYEGHYKINRLPFSPRWLTSLQLLLQRRSPAFLQTVNFVTAPKLNRIFFSRNVRIMRVEPAWLLEWAGSRSRIGFQYWFAERFGIGRDQFIFLKKLA